MSRLQQVSRWQDIFHRIGASELSSAWHENINSRLTGTLDPSAEPIVFAVPIFPESQGCDSGSSLPDNKLVVREVKLGHFSDGGFEKAAEYGNLVKMDDVVAYFSDGFFVATDRRFIIVSTEKIREYPYTSMRKAAMTENQSIYHSCVIEFADRKILSAEFCFPSAGILHGVLALESSRQGYSSPSKQVVADRNQAARQGAGYIYDFLAAVMEVANRAGGP